MIWDGCCDVTELGGKQGGHRAAIISPKRRSTCPRAHVFLAYMLNIRDAACSAGNKMALIPMFLLLRTHVRNHKLKFTMSPGHLEGPKTAWPVITFVYYSRKTPFLSPSILKTVPRLLCSSCRCCSLLECASRQGRDLLLEELVSPGPNGRVLPVVEGKERREEILCINRD